MTNNSFVFKQSFTWWSFYETQSNPEVLLQAAAQMGFAAVELLDSSLWATAKQCGLEIAAINGYDSKGCTFGLNHVQHHPEILSQLKTKLLEAKKWAIPNLIVFSGNRATLTDEAGAVMTAQGLQKIARLAEDTGVTLLLELLNSKVDHLDYQCDRTDWGVKVIEMVDSPNVKLLYDVYHMQIMEGDLIRTIETHHQHFAHYHLGGNPGRHEIGHTQEINYQAVLKAIAQTGYTGYVAHEYLPTFDSISSLQQAFNLTAQI
jgi:hydroxypyruvate isomerase